MVQPAKSSLEKPWRQVWLTRAALGVTIPGMLLGAGLFFFGALNDSKLILVAGWCTAALCIVFNMLVAFSWSIFGFQHSWLGRVRQREAPHDWRPAQSLLSGMTIPGCYNGFARFEFGPGGILISVFVFGPMFIASDQIKCVAKDTWGYVRIDHSSPEIRGPIYVGRSVAAAMDRCMPELSLVRR